MMRTALVFLLFGFVYLASAELYNLDTIKVYQPFCFEMYSKSSVPFFSMNRNAEVDLNGEKTSSDFTFCIYNQKDSSFIGIDNNLICTKQLYEAQKCGISSVNHIIVKEGTPLCAIHTGSSHGDDDISEKYVVERKGRYCLMYLNTTENDVEVPGTLALIHPYGSLPAENYPYLPFYFTFSIVYLFVGLLWMIAAACYWKEIMQIQIYISGIIFLCMLDMLINFAYYSEWNTSGTPSNGLFTFGIVLNSSRNSCSSVALLTVCLGYGLAKPSLGSTGYKVISLGLAQFFFNTLYYSATSNSVGNNAQENTVAFLFVFPLAITLTIFYSWIFTSLGITIKKFELKRQSKKALVYKKLWRVLVISILLVFIFFIIKIIQYYDPKFVEDRWSSAWYFNGEGWLHMLYFFVLICVIFLFRPKKNNTRYGVSVPLDDDDDVAEDDDVSQTHATGSATSERVKMRNLRKATKNDEEDEALRWVQENVPEEEDEDDHQEDPVFDEDEEKAIRRELSKMN